MLLMVALLLLPPCNQGLRHRTHIALPLFLIAKQYDVGHVVAELAATAKRKKYKGTRFKVDDSPQTLMVVGSMRAKLMDSRNPTTCPLNFPSEMRISMRRAAGDGGPLAARTFVMMPTAPL